MTGGYQDHHLHVLASAAARLSVDVSMVGSIAELGQRIVAAAGGGAGWLRCWGYDEFGFGERHDIGCDDLDRWCPHRPVVLHHRTGHVAVLNSLALAEIGAQDHERGVLVDRHDLLARVPRLAADALANAAAAMSREWQGRGVAAITDATHTNGVDELELLAAWRRADVLVQDVTAMLGVSALAEGPRFGDRIGDVLVGHAKVMPERHVLDEIPHAVDVARAHGFPVAVHVTDIDVLDRVLGELARAPSPTLAPDRLEHNALCLPEQVGRIADVGATVVVNPSFLLHRARKYRTELSAVEQTWLIRIRSLLDAGISVLAGSDSPVTPSSPAEMITGARRHPFSVGERVDLAAARRLCARLDAV
jgi:predicted amidohydrolase YtcJ